MNVVVERYGDAAFEALAAELAQRKGDDPLAPVTVVVPRGRVALATRRRLARRAPGVVNVGFCTLATLAAELAAPWVAATGRRPVTPAVLAEAVRSVLAEPAARALSSVPDQPATVRALVQTCQELRGAPPGALARVVDRGGQPAKVARAIAAVGRRLEGFYDDADLLAAATDVVRADPGRLGPVVLYLPERLRHVELELLSAIAVGGRLTAVIGTTGDPVADGPARDLVSRLGATGGEAAFDRAAAGAGERGTAVLGAPTADAEVLAAVRHLMAESARGTPLERMAIAHSGAAPYPRLVYDVLAGAGIPFNSTGIRPLAATVAGRTLLGAFDLADGDWRRDDVVAWMSSAPLRHLGREVPAIEWGTLSCEAGVVGGLDQWRERPVALAAALRTKAEVERGEVRGAWLRRRAERCEEMAGFVLEVAGRMAEPSDGWATSTAWALRLLSDLLGDAAHHAGWPPPEVAALEAVTQAVRGLATVSPERPGPGGFRAALAAELEAPAPLTSRFGHGIMVGRMAEMAGLDLDVLWVVGMIDGAFPGRPPDDVLVPDAVREPCGLPLRGARAAEARRDYLAGLAAASVDRRLSYATGDQRQGKVQRPARLLLDTLGHLAGRRLFARDLEALGPLESFTVVPSFTAVVGAATGDPISPDDWDLRSLLRWVEAGHRPADHFAVAAETAAGFALQRGRSEGRFTRYDGRIDGVIDPAPTPDGAVQSATRLETYAICPRRYLFSRLLDVSVTERPEDRLRISALDRGTLVHRVLERFVAEELDRPEVQGDGAARLERIADEEFADVERRGLCGLPALWHLDRAAIWGELRHFLREDARHRAEHGARPVAVESPFGTDGGAPVDVGLAGGARVRFRGRIDRIDRTVTGGLFVLDYKTGSRRKEEEDPVQRGTRLQLVLYGLAARDRYHPTGPVQVRYWFVSDKAAPRGRFPQEGFELGAAVEHRFAEVVSTLVEGVEGGRFPGNPASCRYCDFAAVCPSDRERSWERKRADPWIDAYRDLADP